MTAYYVMFNTDARLSTAFRDYVGGGALGYNYDARDRVCGGRRPEPADWTDADDNPAGKLDCLSVPYGNNDTQYSVAWYATKVNVLGILQDTSSMHTTYAQWADAGPNY